MKKPSKKIPSPPRQNISKLMNVEISIPLFAAPFVLNDANLDADEQAQKIQNMTQKVLHGHTTKIDRHIEWASVYLLNLGLSEEASGMAECMYDEVGSKAVGDQDTVQLIALPVHGTQAGISYFAQHVHLFSLGDILKRHQHIPNAAQLIWMNEAFPVEDMVRWECREHREMIDKMCEGMDGAKTDPPTALDGKPEKNKSATFTQKQDEEIVCGMILGAIKMPKNLVATPEKMISYGIFCPASDPFDPDGSMESDDVLGSEEDGDRIDLARGEIDVCIKKSGMPVTLGIPMTVTEALRQQMYDALTLSIQRKIGEVDDVERAFLFMDLDHQQISLIVEVGGERFGPFTAHTPSLMVLNSEEFPHRLIGQVLDWPQERLNDLYNISELAQFMSLLSPVDSNKHIHPHMTSTRLH